MNINYCVIVIFTYMKRKNIARRLGPVTKVQPEIKVILDEKGPSGNTDQGTISWFHITKLEMWDKAHIMQLITLCEVNSRKCGSEVTWPERGQRPTSGHSESQINCPYFLLLTSQCYRFIGEQSDINFKVYFDKLWTEPMILDSHAKQTLNVCPYMYYFHEIKCVCVFVLSCMLWPSMN